MEPAPQPTAKRFSPLNIMKLDSPQSAILSAVIFNALIIIALIPLALREVKYRAIGAAALVDVGGRTALDPVRLRDRLGRDRIEGLACAIAFRGVLE